MGDENPIRTLGDYSKPRHEGYRNTIEIPVGNNVVPLRYDTIRLVQNGCSFYGLRFEDPNQHLKDFLNPVDSLDLDEPSRQKEFKDLVMNFILDQEEKVRQLKEYMCVIGSDFMQLFLEVIGKLKEKIRIEQIEPRKSRRSQGILALRNWNL
nr:zinc finger, CCHC-type [Tanacetum cinerariifolium]